MHRVFHVYGKVQGVMFRQTFIRGCLKRELRAGATNNRERADKVTCTVEGDEKVIQELIEKLTNGKPINSWGALVEDFEESVEPFPIEEHQVTTDNLDSFKWSRDVVFYL
jgi:acylphosphatase